MLVNFFLLQNEKSLCFGVIKHVYSCAMGFYFIGFVLICANFMSTIFIIYYLQPTFNVNYKFST